MNGRTLVMKLQGEKTGDGEAMDGGNADADEDDGGDKEKKKKKTLPLLQLIFDFNFFFEICPEHHSKFQSLRPAPHKK